ncbi:DMT family transporter [Samsonia erythrinae]|uniref:Small multidrug resistance pump n=1 Tax=Samsonia erythrinae TaxID=160434 RepID=A0A4R3VKY8_9GAMM|nr:SMR family transporter [Samsonia erythrinae]TCV04894.1 small multidrug resistance pump [Samsonia erythrinae]
MNFALLIIFAGAVCSTVGTLAIQRSDNFRKPAFTLTSVGCYSGSTVLLSLALTYLPVALTHALWSGTVALFLLVFDRFFLKIRLPAYKIVGTLCVIAGIALLSMNG